jgi:VCBS repeat-containing protein
MQSLTNPHPYRAPQSPVPHPRDIRGIARHSSLAKLLGRTVLCGVIGCAAVNAADVRLAWNANTETDIAGYRLTYGTSAGSRPSTVNTGAVTTATVTGLAEGRTYYFAVQAVNQDGLVSDPSSEISYQVPSTTTNRAPVAAARTATTNEDQAVAITLSATDADGNALTYSIVTQPGMGTLSGSGANRTYTPNANANGTDTFTYRANDGSLNSNTATVTITVTPVNDAPVAGNLTVTTAEDQAVGIVLAATDKEASSLAYSIVSPPTKGTLSGSGANRTYTPNADVTGTDTFTYRASDGSANSNTATVSITISAVNDAPVAASQSLNTTEGRALPITLSATDKEQSTLTYRIVTQPTKGTLSGSGASRTYTPNAGATGNDSFTFRANDGSANSNTATINISVSAVNAAPVAANRTATTSEDKAVAITLSATDADGDALTYSIVSQPAKGTLGGSGASRTYTPNADAHGSDSFTYLASDGTLNSTPATVTITITPVNDPPVAAAQSLKTSADQALDLVLAATDKDGDNLNYRIVSEPAQGTLSGSGATLSYAPDADATGTDTFTYVANDGKTDSNNGLVTIAVSPAKPPVAGNSAPQFAAGTLTVTVRQRQNFEALIEATDTDAGDALVYRKINGPAWLDMTPHGRLLGTPPAGTAGTVRCRVRATDKAGAYDETIVEIKVGPAPLPLPWSLARFGELHAKTDAFSKSGSLTLKSSGTAGSREDSGVFAWQMLSDQGQITVRISALANASKDMRVGVMMRRSLAAHAKFAFLGVDGQGRIHWSQRAMAAAASKGASREGGKLPDVWLRLSRSAAKITAFTSRNGRDWTYVGSVWRRDVALSPSCYIGLWASSGSDDLCSAVFRNVSVTP